MPSYEDRIDVLEERLGIRFRDRKLLYRAFTHPSYPNEHCDAEADYEHLEFLGDAVLNLLVAEHLVRNFPNETEGHFTEWRNALISNALLADISRKLKLEQMLRASNGTLLANESPIIKLSADLFEAVLGAIYLDQGIGACRLVVDLLINAFAKSVVENTRNVKRDLQRIAYSKFQIIPRYQFLFPAGKDHGKIICVGVFLGDYCLAQATGNSKREAGKTAAEIGLERIQTLNYSDLQSASTTND